MGKQVVQESSYHSYTWIVRKQLNFFDGTEYMIEIKELEGCVSYGKTFAEAKKVYRNQSNSGLSIVIKIKRYQQNPKNILSI
ncbi:hypothetical protein H1D32_05710 [Anaerobacillus sp. CMMVII]|uniref:type II toxin-antitoxin system HicB family antitoxin n=1 Tax=Anaerobacillus sp. CMMVII TaxID=2755588 RepID=UPI0021B7D4AA|nr:hypothetical protein [Anaerobacillus sp. CMMVII]MCT8137284.1 hypothetical protein [Anaerobacillus sp. CMMVII]